MLLVLYVVLVLKIVRLLFVMTVILHTTVIVGSLTLSIQPSVVTVKLFQRQFSEIGSFFEPFKGLSVVDCVT